MNYAGIYDRFIAARRLGEPALIASGAYAERHHIIPRSLGGGDGPENIVTLTPEDHFFAHLLLAKTHGGKLWAPVAFMVGGSRKDYKPTQSRVAHGWAARAMAAAITGQNAYQFDRTIYRLEHRDGRRWAGTQYEMHSELGLTRPHANLLAKGNADSARGWRKDGATPKLRSGKHHPMYKPDTHHFMHVDGREFIGTQFEFRESCGVGKAVACKLVTGVAAVWNGWHLKGAVLPTFGRGAKWNAIAVANKMRAETEAAQVA